MVNLPEKIAVCLKVARFVSVLLPRLRDMCQLPTAGLKIFGVLKISVFALSGALSDSALFLLPQLPTVIGNRRARAARGSSGAS